MGREERDCNAGSFTLRLNTTIASIEIGRQALNEYLESFTSDDRLLNRLEVVFEELVSNIARHANGARQIVIHADFIDAYEGGGAAVTLVVEDDGSAFDPLSLPESAMTGPLDNVQLGGLGIPLVKRLTRTISYARVGVGSSFVNRVVAVITS